MPDSPTAAFISYSREDSEFALRLAQDLRAAGANVWIDQLDIHPGKPWDNAIEDALQNSPQMLAVLSPTSVRSENVRDEIAYALKQGKIVIPVLYMDCLIPLRLERKQYIDFRSDYARGLSALLHHLRIDHPNQSVLDKAAEDDAIRQAAWLARQAEAKRLAGLKEQETREDLARQKEAAERAAIEEAERRAREQADRSAREAAEQQAREEAARKAAEAESVRRESEERKRREQEVEAQRQKEAADRKAREEAEQRTCEDAAQRAREAAASEATLEEIIRKTAEERMRREREQEAQREKEAADRKAREKAERKTRAGGIAGAAMQQKFLLQPKVVAAAWAGIVVVILAVVASSHWSFYAGAKWIPLKSTTVNLYSMAASSDGKTLYTCGYGSVFLNSLDGGATWVDRGTGVKSSCLSLFTSADGARVWGSASGNSRLVESTDHGVNWTVITTKSTATSPTPGGAGASSDFFTEFFGNPNAPTTAAIFGTPDGIHLWAVGTKGDIEESDDGSATWATRTSSTTSNLSAISGPPEGSFLAAAGVKGTIVVSNDAGSSWQTSASEDFARPSRDLCFRRRRHPVRSRRRRHNYRVGRQRRRLGLALKRHPRSASRSFRYERWKASVGRRKLGHDRCIG